MKPKIVQICALDSTMYKMLNTLNKKSLEEGFEVHCICSDGEYVNKLRECGYIVHPIKIAREINIKDNLITIKNICSKLKQIKPNIVHVHTPIAAVLGRIAAKLAKVKTIIYTAHGFYFHEGMSKKQYKTFYNIEKYVGRFLTDYIFTQSEEDYSLAKEGNFLPLKKKKNYLHISNGIDLTNRFNLKRFNASTKCSVMNEHNISNDTMIISFIGRMVKEKGIFDLIEAMKLLEGYKDIHLFAIGGLPESERDKSLKGFLENVNDINNITFTGKIENVEDYLFTSDIFILPSYREGMPRSIIEAMSMKNAVIATNIRGSREEVIPKFNGYLVEIQNPIQIKDMILDLYNNREKLKKFKENSLTRAQQLYDENDVVQKQIMIFKEVIE